jgi:hypothetical protein
MNKMLDIARTARKWRKQKIAQIPPGIPLDVRITEYNLVRAKGKGKVATQNAINRVSGSILAQIQQLLRNAKEIPEFPLKFTLYMNREAVNLNTKSWQETGLQVEVSLDGSVPKAKGKVPNLWFTVRVSIADPTKPVAEACLEIIRWRKEKSEHFKEAEKTFLDAAERIQAVIVEHLPALAHGDVNRVIMPIYLMEGATAWGWKNIIKRVPTLFDPAGHGSQFNYPTAFQCNIHTEPLHVLDFNEPKN